MRFCTFTRGLLTIGVVFLACASALITSHTSATTNEASVNGTTSTGAVNLVNDAPTNITLSSSTVPDNSVSDTTVGNFSTTDVDSSSFVYTLVSGAGSSDNTAFVIAGSVLQTAAFFDFEAKSIYSIRVRSTDDGGTFFEKQFTINVIDGPDNPGAISFAAANFSVGEGDGNAILNFTRTGGVDNKVVAKVTAADVTTSQNDYSFPVPGRIDGTFTPGTGPGNYASNVVIQPDGKMIIAGFFKSYNGVTTTGIARLNVNGTLDTTFNPTIEVVEADGLALQPDGKVIVVGFVRNIAGGPVVGIARLNPDGSTDSTFVIGTGFGDYSPRSTAIQPDGKILVGGNFPSYNGVARADLVRINSDGSLDTGYLAGAGPDSDVISIVVQPDGKAIIGGRFNHVNGVTRHSIARLTSDGSLDATFAPASIVDEMEGDSLALQPDGKVLAGGIFYIGSASDSTDLTPLIRLNGDGSLDGSFTSNVGHKNIMKAIVVQPDGKIFAGGLINRFPQDALYFLNRLNVNGSTDSAFNSGIVAFSNSGLYSMALYPDGKLVVVGQFSKTFSNTVYRFIDRIEGDVFVNWPAGDASNKTVLLPIVNDSTLEPDETLTLSLTPVSGGATTGANPTSTLTILDNDTTVTAVSGSGVYNQTATLRATLGSLSSTLSGKTLSFTLNGTPVGSAVTNSSGVATLTNVNITGMNAGSYFSSIIASFAGDVFYGNSSSAGTLTISKAPASTTLATSVTPSDFGQSVTFTATVTSTSGTPTGTVTFRVDGSSIGSGTLNASGVGTIATSTMATGTHTITADLNSTNFTAGSATLSGGQVVKTPPSLSINDVSIDEGDSGTKLMTFTVTLTPASNATVSVNFATANGTATAPADYVATNGALTFNPGITTRPISVTINGDTTFENNETLFVNLTGSFNASIGDPQGLGTIVNDDFPGGLFRFSSANYSTTEGSAATVTVQRTGNTTQAVTVDFTTSGDTGLPCATASGTASSKCDFTAAVGTLAFAATETSKTFDILINQDSFVEGPETLTLTLANPTVGAGFATPATATVTIADDLTEPPTNAIDNSGNFVRQHYLDFLNREPDPSGQQFWQNQIDSCGTDQACLDLKHVNVSAAFFISVEFQQTGYLVERIYKTAYGDAAGSSTFGGVHVLSVPVVRLNEFLPDTRSIGQGLIVGQTGWEQTLENNKQAFTANFVQRARFLAAYPASMTESAFVDKLNANAGNPLSTSERNQLVVDLLSGDKTRAQALRAVAEDPDLNTAEFNRAFVLMQYFGYLRRNPNDPQDTDYTGYDFWLTKLNQFNGNFVTAEMVKAFILSGEYRNRFGP